MIGRCEKMQKLTWDKVIRRCDGVPYDINFDQDFSSLYVVVVERPITEIPVTALIETARLLLDQASDLSKIDDPYYRQRRPSMSVIERAEQQRRNELKREKKWRKKYPKPKSPKEAFRNFQKDVDDLMRGDRPWRM